MKLNLKELRNARGLTMQELASISGVTKDTINSIENDRINNEEIRLSTLIKLCKALKCKMSDLLPKELRRYCK